MPISKTFDSGRNIRDMYRVGNFESDVLRVRLKVRRREQQPQANEGGPALNNEAIKTAKVLLFEVWALTRTLVPQAVNFKAVHSEALRLCEGTLADAARALPWHRSA